jgi:hypothetical protein
MLEPAATLAYPAFLASNAVGDVVSISPFAVSPAAWVIFVAVLLAAAYRLAPSRFGWPLAVAASVLVAPRLLVYQLSTLIAGLRAPDEPVGERP